MPPYASENEVSITVLRLFTSLHSSINQELFEKYLRNQSSHYENMDGALSSETEVFIVLLCQLQSTEQYESRTARKALLIKVATMKNMNNLLLSKGSHHVKSPNQCFSLSSLACQPVVMIYFIHCVVLKKTI